MNGLKLYKKNQPLTLNIPRPLLTVIYHLNLNCDRFSNYNVIYHMNLDLCRRFLQEEEKNAHKALP